MTAAAGWMPSAAAAPVEIRAAYLPPNMDRDGEGREADIIRATLQRCGHQPSFVIEPFTRHWKSYELGQGDAVSTVPPGRGLAGRESVPYIGFQNGVSTLVALNADISSPADLAGMDVIAFSGAREILKPLADAVPTFKSYREVANQVVQSRLLFSGRADAVVSDGMIFAEYNRQLRESDDDLPFDPTQPVAFRKSFDPTFYAMVFRDSTLAEDFDRCFAELAADGTIHEINRLYVDRYRAVLGGDYLGF